MSKRFFVPVLIIVIFATGFAAAVMLKSNSDTQQVPSTSQANPSSQVSSATSLDYSGRGLTSFPKEVLGRTDTSSLNLSNNNLTGALPGEIRHLTNLEELNVSNNKMTGIPAEIGQLKRLKVLNYANNKITGLPLELGNLTQLQVLDLSGNNASQHDLSLIRPKLPNTEIKL